MGTGPGGEPEGPGRGEPFNGLHSRTETNLTHTLTLALALTLKKARYLKPNSHVKPQLVQAIHVPKNSALHSKETDTDRAMSVCGGFEACVLVPPMLFQGAVAQGGWYWGSFGRLDPPCRVPIWAGYEVP